MPAPVFTPISFDKDDNPYDSGAGYMEKWIALSGNFSTLANYLAEVELTVEETTAQLVAQTAEDRAAVEVSIVGAALTLAGVVAADRLLAQNAATASSNSANAAAASAASAAEIANLADVQKFTALLRKEIAVLMTAAASGATGLQFPSSAENNFPFDNFTPHWKGYLPDFTPSAIVILVHKHDGTNGYILSVATDAKIRVVLNGFTYVSTVAATFVDGDVNEIETPIIRETASAAGQILFIVNGVQVGASVAIAAHGDLTVERIADPDFTDDPNTWTDTSIGTGGVTFTSGDAHLVGPNGSANRASMRHELAGVIAGDIVELTINATVNSGSLRASLVGVDGSPSAKINTGVNTIRLAAAGVTPRVYIYNMSSGGDANFALVSAKLVASAETTSPLYIMGTSTTRSGGAWIQTLLYNRAISALDSLRRIKSGNQWMDTSGSNTRLLSENFESGVTGWSRNNGGSLTHDTTNPISGAGSLKSNVTGSNFVGGASKLISGIFETGKRYGVRFKYRLSAPGAMFLGIDSPSGGAIELTIVNNLSATTSTEIYAQFVMPSQSGPYLVFWPVYNAGAAFDYWLDDLEIWELGVTFNAQAANAQSDTGQCFETANNKHGVMPSSGAVRSEPLFSGRTDSENTWLATNELQYISGFNQPILPQRAGWIVLDMFNTAGSSVTVDVGDGADQDRFASAVVLAPGPNRVTLANPFTDGTNRKVTIKPSATYSGTIITSGQFNFVRAA